MTARAMVDRWLDSRAALREAIDADPPRSRYACWICGSELTQRVPIPGMSGTLVCAVGSGCQREAEQ